MKKFAYLILFIAVACLTTGLVSCGVKAKGGENVLNTEATETEPTEAPTEAATEPETEPATEAPTEAPTEPATEAPTEPEVEMTIKARDTMLNGPAVGFNVGYKKDYGGTNNVAEINQKTLVTPIKNGSEYDPRRGFVILYSRSTKEFRANLSLLKKNMEETTEYEKYNDQFFRENALIILCQGADEIKTVTKVGAELCINGLTRLSQPGDITDCAIHFDVQYIEISKADLDGIDTISFFVEAK
ncbi:MAG: hypothetical protein HFE78_04135 [Clostridiales bacterium]|nr:hypothetical protein [Clostridiales bacterium]